MCSDNAHQGLPGHGSGSGEKVLQRGHKYPLGADGIVCYLDYGDVCTDVHMSKSSKYPFQICATWCALIKMKRNTK